MGGRILRTSCLSIWSYLNVFLVTRLCVFCYQFVLAVLAEYSLEEVASIELHFLGSFCSVSWLMQRPGVFLTPRPVIHCVLLFESLFHFLALAGANDNKSFLINL